MPFVNIGNTPAGPLHVESSHVAAVLPSPNGTIGECSIIVGGMMLSIRGTQSDVLEKLTSATHCPGKCGACSVGGKVKL